MYKSLICGGNSNVELDYGKLVHYINFNNAGTTPPFKSVIEKINDFSCVYSSVNRGSGYKSEICSDIYEDSRKKVLEFLGGDSDYHTVVFLKNATECINKLSYRLKYFLKDRIVLTTYMEHHSNMLPWQDRYDTDFVKVDRHGRLSLKDLDYKLRYYRGRVGLLAVTGASNVTGYINPVHDIAELCHSYNAKILVDGAQLIPHSPFNLGDVQDPRHIDFLVFSGHKMYAPFGTGALIAPKEVFKEGYSEYVGGGTVEFVSTDSVTWADIPQKEEAGTPNLMGVIALIESIRTLSSLSMDKIDQYERDLTAYTLEKMRHIPNLMVYDDYNIDKKVSIISFNIKGIYHETLARILAQEGGISTRSGCFCAQPYVQSLLKLSNEEAQKYRNNKNNLPGMVRISFGLYNDYNEIDLFIYLLKKISNNIDYYISKYSKPPLEKP